MDEMLSVKDVSKSFGGRTIVDSVSFTLSRGERLGIEGRSGSGKTTLMKCILRLVEPDSGSVIFHGIDLLRIPGQAEEGPCSDSDGASGSRYHAQCKDECEGYNPGRGEIQPYNRWIGGELPFWYS